MKLIDADELMRRVWRTELGPHRLGMVLAKVIDDMPAWMPYCTEDGKQDASRLCPWCAKQNDGNK